MKVFFIFLVFTFSLYSYERPLVVITASYNNAQWYRQNLDSIFSQNYTNYRLLYIDDCSTDGTYELVRDYITEHHQEQRTTLIHNNTRQGACANRYIGSHLCAPDEIVMIVDGDDWLAHDNVMNIVNQAYENKHVWLTYGQFKRFPSNRIGFVRFVAPKNPHRTSIFLTSHLRTYYAGLFQQIKLKDCLFESQFYQATGDLAEMLPMLELADTHVQYIPDVMYIYNEQTPFNDYKINERVYERMKGIIRSCPPYSPLPALILEAPKTPNQTDVLLISQNIAAAEQTLISLRSYTNALNTIHLCCDYPVQQREKQLKNLLPGCTIMVHHDSATGLYAALNSSAQYFLLLSDQHPLGDIPDLRLCTQYLARTHAYGYYLNKTHVAQRVNKAVHLYDGLHAWQFGPENRSFGGPHQYQALYPRRVFEAEFINLRPKTFAEFIALWMNESVDPREVAISIL